MKMYKKLAEKLDLTPNRYPKTESGVEVRLLEKIFSPDEAALGAEMFFDKEPAGVIASRVGISEKGS